jgi:hypothetical protein
VVCSGNLFVTRNTHSEKAIAFSTASIGRARLVEPLLSPANLTIMPGANSRWDGFGDQVETLSHHCPSSTAKPTAVHCVDRPISLCPDGAGNWRASRGGILVLPRKSMAPVCTHGPPALSAVPAPVLIGFASRVIRGLFVSAVMFIGIDVIGVIVRFRTCRFCDSGNGASPLGPGFRRPARSRSAPPARKFAIGRDIHGGTPSAPCICLVNTAAHRNARSTCRCRT